MRDGGDRSRSEKCLLKSSKCVIDRGELFSLTLILIVSPEIKELCIFTETIKFLAFRPKHFVIWAQASVYEDFTILR